MPLESRKSQLSSKTPIFRSAGLLSLVLTPIAEAGPSNAPQSAWLLQFWEDLKCWRWRRLGVSKLCGALGTAFKQEVFENALDACQKMASLTLLHPPTKSGLRHISCGRHVRVACNFNEVF